MPMVEDGRVEAQNNEHDTSAGEDGTVDSILDEVGDDDQDEEPSLEIPANALRRSTRERKPSSRYSPHEFVLLTDGEEPEYFGEAVEDESKAQWLEAMQEEMKSLLENDTYELVKLPKGMRVLKNKWVFRIKNEEHNSKPRYKARLVVRGFSQRKGVDYEEIFSLVVRMSSIRAVLGLAASLDLEIKQMDVKTVFFHGDLDKEIYMEQPEGFVVKGKKDFVCKLKKSLYGLKQAPRQWYKKFESVMGKYGYRKTTSDHCVFVQKFSDNDFIILLLYVDDILIVGKNALRINELKKQLSKFFAMKDLGPAKQILETITRYRDSKKLYLSQEKYIKKVLQRFGMNDSKCVASSFAPHFKLSTKQCPTTDEEKQAMDEIPYASAVGSLMYAMVYTRPDIAHAVGTVSRFLSNPGKEH
ncbi:retrovirus-related Pol polyprotein from transposon TNT 1-94 [Arachis hypogaea]|uniref:retrovirus-related Pol polyprotein from transposon TNT 1-94 n=1 Tax=Arachis hypogaea TaxID=3818 RepID=UPI003B2208F4